MNSSINEYLNIQTDPDSLLSEIANKLYFLESTIGYQSINELNREAVYQAVATVRNQIEGYFHAKDLYENLH